jgi:hypothetical protein
MWLAFARRSTGVPNYGRLVIAGLIGRDALSSAGGSTKRWRAV